MDGTIVTAHCKCLAGLGEVCSRVGAVLFAVEAGVRIREAQTCTSLACKWLMPIAVKSVLYEELCSIDFTSAKAKKRKLDDKISDISTQSAELVHGCQAFPKNPSYLLSQDQIKTLYESLHGTGIEPAINALVPPYNQEYLPKVETLNLPQHLPDRYDENLIEQTYDDLVRKARDIFTSMSCTSKKNLQGPKANQIFDLG